MKVSGVVGRGLRLERGESRAVGLMMALNFLICFAAVEVQTAGFALFLDRFGPGQLAGAYLVSAAGSAAAAAIYLVAAERTSFQRLTTGVLIVLVIGTVIAWTGARGGRGAARYLLPMWFQIIINMGMLIFWALADMLFDVRQAKRLFGVLSAGRSLGFVAGGLAAPLLVRFVGTPALLLVSSTSLASAVVIIGKVWRIEVGSPVVGRLSSTRPGRGRRGRSLVALVRHRYYGLIIGYVTIWWIGYYVVDKVFLDQVVAHTTDQMAIAQFLGVFFAVAGALQFVVGAFITGRVAHRKGLTMSLVSTPTLLLIGAVIFTVGTSVSPAGTGLLVTAVAMKGLDHGVGFGLDMAVHGIAYRPVPLAVVGKVATLAEGFGQPVALAVAALGLIGLQRGLGLGTTALGVTLAVVTVVWLAAAVRLGRSYPVALAGSLARRQFSGDRRAFVDRASRDAILAATADRAPAVALYAARTLADLDEAALVAALPALSTHSSADVRRWALASIEQRADRTLLSAWTLSGEPDAAARQQGVRALVACDRLSGDSVGTIRWLDDEDPAVRRGAIEGSLRGPAPPATATPSSVRALAVDRVIALSKSPSERDRVDAARMIEAGGARDLVATLAELIDAESPSVSRAAIRAMASLGPFDDPGCYRSMVAATARSACAAAAGAALARLGPSALPAMRAASSGEASRAQSAILAASLGRIGGVEALRVLDPFLDHVDGRVRASACAALVTAAAPTVTDAGRVMACLKRETDDVDHIVDHIRSLPEPDAQAVVGALRSSLVRAVSNVIALAAVLSPDGARGAVAYRLVIGTRLTRLAEVTELLEPELSGPVRQLVIPVLERIARPATPTAVARVALAELIAGPSLSGAPLTGTSAGISVSDPWVRATACHLAGTRRVVNCRIALGAACHDEDATVREAARRALATIDHQKEEPAMFSTVDKVLALKRVSLFAETPDDVLAAVAGLLRQTVVDSGVAIVCEGDPGEEMYVIASGRVEARRGGHLLNELGDGEVFGEMAVLDPGPRSATVTSLEPTHLLVLDQAPLHDLLIEQPQIALGIISVLVRHLRDRVSDLETSRSRSG